MKILLKDATREIHGMEIVIPFTLVRYGTDKLVPTIQLS